MRPAEELLENAATDGSFDSDDWPRVLQAVILRLDSAIREEFPTPSKPITSTSPIQAPRQLLAKAEEPSSQESQSANKENAPPPGSVQPASTSGRSDGPDGLTTSPSTLPPDILTLHDSIRTTLSRNFPNYPPYTIQRLAELVLRPKQHYRFLPSYLHALDRVVSVSSSTKIFPLPQAILPSTSTGLPNGASVGDDPPPTSIAPSPFSSASLGSDESLGGALLTPIPWLRPDRDRRRPNELRSEETEMVDGPHGAGRIETVSVINGGLSTTPTVASNATTDNNGSTQPVSPEAILREAGSVTQGELLRQEQEAGVVPISHAGGPRSVTARAMQGSSGGNIIDSTEVEGEGDGTAGEEERPHARGPEEIGMEDMGPQGRPPGGSGLDLEAAVGRSAASAGSRGEKGGDGGSESGAATGVGKPDESVGTEAASARTDTEGDADGDVMLTDADGRAGDKQALGDNTAPDAIDTTGR